MSHEVREVIKKLCKSSTTLDREQQDALSLIAHGMALQKSIEDDKAAEADGNTQK